MADSPTMEPSPPSAQIVGQEFVKQYYTMLNAAPDHLHRFYSNNSSFIHGNADMRGEEQQAVTGQLEIHKKILSLNFNNCHARICQVDSQLSVGGSVVVQVIGELSNDGQPMRRFVQTFVLAPQTAKKYYVHSDIFRYQDIYCANANDGGADGEGEYAEEEAPGEDTDELRYDSTTAEAEQPTITPRAGGYEEHEQEPAVDSGCDMSEPNIVTPVHNSSVSTSDGLTDEAAGKLSTLVVQEAEDKTVVAQAGSVEEPTDVVEPIPEVKVESERVVEVAEKPAAPTPPPAEPVAPPKPMTWAAMASRNAAAVTPGGAGMTRPQPVAQPSGGRPTTTSATGSRPHSATTSETKAEMPVNSVAKPATRTTGNGDVNGRLVMNGGKDEGSAGGGLRRSLGSSGQLQNYPDAHQVFIGNLPQAFTDQEVVEFFEQYGKVLEFRINRKTGMGGNNVSQKNFGFMAFDGPEAVRKVLDSRPIVLKKWRLNIEEKKPKEELAAARFSTPRYPATAGGAPRSGEGVSRRGGFNRSTDSRSNASEDAGGRTY